MQRYTGGTIDDGTLYPERQVRSRRSMTVINADFSPEVFWDGRGRGPFIDPETDTVAIPVGGVLEIQALGPILSTVEMSHEGRAWGDVTTKLAAATPLALATDLPTDVRNALNNDPTYSELFQSAFGTPDVTARRIAFAIATYERTLRADQTPFDEFARGNAAALTPNHRVGLGTIRRVCGPCHNGPDFSDHNFHNTGVRPSGEDIGRQEVTGNPADASRFKTPGLRNVSNRGPFFHNGGPETLTDVINFYNRGGDFDVNVAPQIRPLNLNANQRNQRDFLENGLTDPRVDASLPPFEHPTLRPHFKRGDGNRDSTVDLGDVILGLRALFAVDATLPCLDSADANDDGTVDIVDVMRTLFLLFVDGQPLPYPSHDSTGPDITEDDLDCASAVGNS